MQNYKDPLHFHRKMILSASLQHGDSPDKAVAAEKGQELTDTLDAEHVYLEPGDISET